MNGYASTTVQPPSATQLHDCALLASDAHTHQFVHDHIMVTMDERAPSFFEKFAVKAKKEPLVPIGAIATVGFLVSGTYVCLPKLVARKTTAYLSQQMGHA